MTNEEAIELTKMLLSSPNCYYCKYYGKGGCKEECTCAMDIAIECIEKQIPKEAWHQADDDTCLYYHWECPTCGHDFGYAKRVFLMNGKTSSYCPECGQSISWEVE